MGKTFKGGHHFPASFGFSGSAGKQCVKGYMRGGRVAGATNGATTKVQPSTAETVETGFAGKELRRGFARGGRTLPAAPKGSKVKMAILADAIDSKGKMVKAPAKPPRTKGVPAMNMKPMVGRPDFAARARKPGGM